MTSPILQPAIALVLWTFVMWAWLYATRIPAIRASGPTPGGQLTAGLSTNQFIARLAS